MCYKIGPIFMIASPIDVRIYKPTPLYDLKDTWIMIRVTWIK
jgi:hypothetical protein